MGPPSTVVRGGPWSTSKIGFDSNHVMGLQAVELLMRALMRTLCLTCARWSCQKVALGTSQYDVRRRVSLITFTARILEEEQNMNVYVHIHILSNMCCSFLGWHLDCEKSGDGALWHGVCCRIVTPCCTLSATPSSQISVVNGCS